MRALVINQGTQARIAQLISHAREHPISLETLQKTLEGRHAPIGDDPLHTLLIPFGFRVVYSHENQPGGLCRHLSVSVDAPPGKGPAIEAVSEIAKLFGFKDGIKSADHIWTEPYSNRTVAVNLIQRVLANDKT